jgi:hypothetical protein
VRPGDLAAQHRDFHVPRVRDLTSGQHAEHPPQDKERQRPHHHLVDMAHRRMVQGPSRPLLLGT